MSHHVDDGWQPIETAPKNRGFLVWFPVQKQLGYGAYAEAGYGLPGEYRFFWFEVAEQADQTRSDSRPTLWHPLPVSPGASK